MKIINFYRTFFLNRGGNEEQSNFIELAYISTDTLFALITIVLK